MKMLRKLLVAAAVLMFASAGAFALSANDIDVAVLGTMSADEFTNYFGDTPADQIAEDLFDGEFSLEEITEDDDYLFEMLSVMQSSIGKVSSDTVVLVCDDTVLIAVHMGSRDFYAYYIE